MQEQGVQASTLCVAMCSSESTFSRKFMNSESNPKSDDIAELARRLNVKVSDIYLKKESLEPELCRFFYSAEQAAIQKDSLIDGEFYHNSYVYIDGEWKRYTEKKSSLKSSNFKDVIYLGEAPRWHTKRGGRVHCPDLYKQLCDEAREQHKDGLAYNIETGNQSDELAIN
jgi:hypothetical protein